MRRAPLLALLALLTLALPLRAQDLEQALDRVATHWQRGDAGAITAMAASAGVSLEVDGDNVGPLGPRQAAAVLRRVFDDRETLSAKPTLSRSIGGQPARAFGEIMWTVRSRGTTIPERATLFVAFIREDGAWRVSEIRLLR